MNLYFFFLFFSCRNVLTCTFILVFITYAININLKLCTCNQNLILNSIKQLLILDAIMLHQVTYASKTYIHNEIVFSRNFHVSQPSFLGFPWQKSCLPDSPRNHLLFHHFTHRVQILH